MNTQEREIKELRKKLRDDHGLRLEKERKVRILRSECKKTEMACKARVSEVRQIADRILWRFEEDRKEISRELHDEVGQLLTGINYQLALLYKEAEKDSEHIAGKILNTQRIIEDSVGVVHRFAQDLRPMILDDLGLVAALKSYLKEFGKKTSVEVVLSVGSRVSILNDRLKTAFFRIAQEALTNIQRHAQASRVFVSIRQTKGVLVMEIHDNGKSFNLGKSVKTKHSCRLGLLGMGERIRMVNGHLKILSTPGKGTRVRVEAPIKSAYSGDFGFGKVF